MKKTQAALRNTFPCQPTDMEPLIEQLLKVRNDVVQKEKAYKNLDKVHVANQKSARNLLQYMAFRLHDIRDLQLLLTEWGLSSLGRAERKVQATLDTVLQAMHLIVGKSWQPNEKPPVCYRDARQTLEDNTDKLLGGHPAGRRVRIMVTMPGDGGSNYHLVKNLLLNGMNCARINCAHDDKTTWKKIVENIRRAEEATGRECRILMDLGGPKLRTGDIKPGPKIVKISPKRSETGIVEQPAHIWLHPEGETPNPPNNTIACLPVPPDWLKKSKVGDTIRLTDARGASRKLTLAEVTESGYLASANKTIYFVPGLELVLKRKGEKLRKGTAKISDSLPSRLGGIPLKIGDLLVLTKQQTPGEKALFHADGTLTQPATIGISIPEVLNDLRDGEPIWFDDGKIGGIIERVEREQVKVRINHTRPAGDTLRAEKGINLPESNLHVAALSPDDLEDLHFVVQHADMVGLSFANYPKDVEDLVHRMKALRKGRVPAVVLKIETRLGFENLPALLLAAMQSPSCGVMIARGDLAIECGFGRLAEVQEQILWICEAAHVPVIWATQVLEGMAKSGLPTRAEVTDAAMGQRAECIMLNKGEHIVEATNALAEILHRMQDHQTKKRSLLRKLSIAERFFQK
ncbi:MAG: pyruvate kinase [Saprospiraceae bacterium]|nr:pyruvate kinase [Saprospiraceae bacterium]